MIATIVLAACACVMSFVAIHKLLDLRADVFALERRVGKHQEALRIQLDYNKAVDKHIDRLDDRRSTRATPEKERSSP